MSVLFFGGGEIAGEPDEKTKIFFLCWILDVDQDRELCVLQPGTVPEAGLRVQKLIVCGHLLPKECFVCYLFSRTLLSLQRHPFLRNPKKGVVVFLLPAVCFLILRLRR